MMVLNENVSDAQIDKSGSTISFHEKAARVAVRCGTQLENAWERCLDSLHEDRSSEPERRGESSDK
jgi:hypothetical protein